MAPRKRKQQRRERGSGSVFYSETRKRWIAKIDTGDNRERRSSHTSRQEAETWLNEMTDERQHRNIAAGSQSLKTYLAKWLEDRRENIAPKTFEFDKLMCEYIVEYIGTIQLDMLQPEHVSQMQKDLKRDGLSARTVAHVRAILRNALGQAIKWRYLTWNVAAAVDPPKIKEPLTAQALNKQQVTALLEAVQGHRIELLYHLAVRLGIRKGELLGLRRSDVNLEMRTIKIAQQVTNVGSKTIVTTPKTARSKRTLPIPDDLMLMVRQQLDRLVVEAAHNHDWQEHGLLFPSEVGTPMQPRNLIRHFKIALTHAKLPNIRFHDLRHTAASLMESDGVPTNAIQALLGHSTPTMTRHYSSHSDMDAMRKAVER